MTSFAVSGYASLDHALQVDRRPQPDRTAVVTARLSPAWPAQGGCAPFVARALARRGYGVHLLSWFGDDEGGRGFVADLAAEGVRMDGAVVGAGRRTASSWLIYDPEGGATCVYDPGDVPMGALSADQVAAVEAADWLVVTVGPQAVNRALLEVVPDEVRVALAVKADPDAFPPDLLRAYAERSAVLAFSRGERPFLSEAVGAEGIAAAGRRGVLIETAGKDGARVVIGGREALLPVEPVEARDTTGAGDTLLGASLAQLAAVPGWPPAAGEAVAAVEDGVEAARAFLQARAREGG